MACGPTAPAADPSYTVHTERFGTEMMTLAIERCFSDASVHAIWIDPLTTNVRARRFYERLGARFVEDRPFGDDDCTVYQLNRLSWAARRGSPLADMPTTREATTVD